MILLSLSFLLFTSRPQLIHGHCHFLPRNLDLMRHHSNNCQRYLHQKYKPVVCKLSCFFQNNRYTSFIFILCLIQSGYLQGGVYEVLSLFLTRSSAKSSMRNVLILKLQDDEIRRAKSSSKWTLYLEFLVMLCVSSVEEFPAILYVVVPER